MSCHLESLPVSVGNPLAERCPLDELLRGGWRIVDLGWRYRLCGPSANRLDPFADRATHVSRQQGRASAGPGTASLRSSGNHRDRDRSTVGMVRQRQRAPGSFDPYPTGRKADVTLGLSSTHQLVDVDVGG